MLLKIGLPVAIGIENLKDTCLYRTLLQSLGVCLNTGLQGICFGLGPGGHPK